MNPIVFVALSLVAVSFAHHEPGHYHQQQHLHHQCGDNEVSNICGKSCEPTCSNRIPNPMMCSKMQCTESMRDCRCVDGFYRDMTSRRCVPVQMCPAPQWPHHGHHGHHGQHGHHGHQCGPNEQMGKCGRRCEATCSNPDMSRCGAMHCHDSGCQCMPGFMRNEKTGMCVRSDMCPHSAMKCGEGEIMAPCGKRCEGTCFAPSTPDMCHKMHCQDMGCRCNMASGFVRNPQTGRCMQMSQCPKKGLRCPANSAPRLCGNICAPTCRYPRELLCKVNPTRCTINCRCLKGYVLNERTKKCVEPKNCRIR